MNTPTSLAFIMPSGAELLIIAAVIVVLFGAKKIPELAKGMRQALQEFRKGIKNDDE